MSFSTFVRERGKKGLCSVSRALIVMIGAGQVCLGECYIPNLRNCTHLTIHSAEKEVVADVMSLPCCKLLSASLSCPFILCSARFDISVFSLHCESLRFHTVCMHVDTGWHQAMWLLYVASCPPSHLHH